MNGFVFQRLQDEMELLDIVEKEREKREKDEKGAWHYTKGGV